MADFYNPKEVLTSLFSCAKKAQSYFLLAILLACWTKIRATLKIVNVQLGLRTGRRTIDLGFDFSRAILCATFSLGSPETSCLAGHVLAQNSFRFCELPFFFPILTLFFERRRTFQIRYMYDFSVLSNISQICPTKAKFWYALPSDQLKRDGYRTLCVRFREPSRVHRPSEVQDQVPLFCFLNLIHLCLSLLL